MSWNDMTIAIEGFNEGEMAAMNRLRHNMWASLSAFGAKIPPPRQLMPLPIDRSEKPSIMTKEEFLQLANKMALLDKNKIAKA